MATDSCLFCRIVAGEEPATFVHRDDEVVAFEDIFPQGPVHVLVVPTRHLDSLHDLTADDRDLLWRCVEVAQQIATDRGTADGYRLATNIGTKGGQAIPHLHFHVLGGRQLGRIDGSGSDGA